MMPVSAIRRFIQLEAAGGMVLMAAAVVALLCANVPGLANVYQWLLEIPIEITIGGLALHKNVLLVINDGLMAVFFLLIAIEIKREMLAGELSSLKQIALPGFAAIGGVAVPALIYFWLNRGDPIAARGWAIPAATDIAFSLAVLALLGTRAPLALKVFLTAVAVVDDLAAIAIIAIFYTSNLSLNALVLAGVGLVGLILLNRFGVRRYAAYVLVGTLVWVCVVKSGVHATLAGVAVGFAIPYRLKNEHGESLSLHLEHVLHPWVAFLILPLFAFANSGVSLRGISLDVLFAPIPLGIALGLIVGKAIGVFSTAALVVKCRLAQLPTGMTWRSMFGVSLLCGIGFTMSLFIGTLAFEGEGAEYAVATRLGVFGGSIIAAVVGYLVLRLPITSATTCPSS